MEDAATAEISRAQVWQWIRHPNGILSDGRKVTLPLVESLLADEIRKLQASVGEERYHAGRYGAAIVILEKILKNDEFTEFLTLPAYEQIS